MVEKIRCQKLEVGSQNKKRKRLAFLLPSVFYLLTSFAHAQFLGYTAPQTVGPITCINAAATPTTSSSTPGTASFIPSLGQSVHYLTYTTSDTIQTMSIQLDGSFNNSTWFRVSETASSPGSGAVSANVYYPFIRCNLTSVTGGGSVTAVYTGTSVIAGNPAGIFNTSGVYTKVLATGAPANAAATYSITLPKGSTGGVLNFLYSGPGPAGSTLGTSAGPDFNHLDTVLSPTVLSTAATVQTIRVADFAANVSRVVYSPLEASAVTYDLSYSFSTVGSSSVDVILWPDSQPIFWCNRTASISITASGNTQIIADPGTGLTYICHVSVAFNAVTNFQLTNGIGTNCDTGTNSLTGTYQSVTAVTLAFSNFAPLQSTAAICVNSSNTVTGGGVIIYTQF